MSEFNQRGDILVERLKSIGDGKTIIQLFNEMNHVALDIIASVNLK